MLPPYLRMGGLTTMSNSKAVRKQWLLSQSSSSEDSAAFTRENYQVSRMLQMYTHIHSCFRNWSVADLENHAEQWDSEKHRGSNSNTKKYRKGMEGWGVKSEEGRRLMLSEWGKLATMKRGRERRLTPHWMLCHRVWFCWPGFFHQQRPCINTYTKTSTHMYAVPMNIYIHM